MLWKGFLEPWGTRITDQALLHNCMDSQHREGTQGTHTHVHTPPGRGRGEEQKSPHSVRAAIILWRQQDSQAAWMQGSQALLCPPGLLPSVPVALWLCGQRLCDVFIRRMDSSICPCILILTLPPTCCVTSDDSFILCVPQFLHP